ncbi:MAG: catechol 2,3-dioxygenase-like lactoylglutathione lyase family enzyme [Alphaproteobacteria bacterium]|jgi:catechol 2,3-dioxygenase-like lactoylglutathione lyase family enzyme
MAEHLHHVHFFTEDIDATIAWWRDMLGGEVIYDGDFGGARNVFMRVGSGRLHLYEQKPRDEGSGAVHHVGIRTDDLAALEQRLRAAGVGFRSGIRDFGAWKYIMCPAPDNVLLELFEVDASQLEGGAAEYFGDMPAA